MKSVWNSVLKRLNILLVQDNLLQTNISSVYHPQKSYGMFCFRIYTDIWSISILNYYIGNLCIPITRYLVLGFSLRRTLITANVRACVSLCFHYLSENPALLLAYILIFPHAVFQTTKKFTCFYQYKMTILLDHHLTTN